MTAVTGETGAGKTMLVEALELLVGGRADSAIVRPGAAEARVDGRFVTGDTELVLTRVVPADGRSRAYVDGRPTTVGALADAGAGLVDLHGQHDHQSLLAGPTQRAALDAFGDVDTAPLRAARVGWRCSTPSWRRSAARRRERAREIDLLRFQVGELEAAGLDDVDEETRLQRDRGRARRRRRSPRGRCRGPRRAGRRRRRPRRRRRRRWLRSRCGRRSGRSPIASLRCSPSSTTSSPRCVTVTEAIEEDPRAAGRWCGPAASCCATCVASTATTWPR